MAHGTGTPVMIGVLSALILFFWTFVAGSAPKSEEDHLEPELAFVSFYDAVLEDALLRTTDRFEVAMRVDEVIIGVVKIDSRLFAARTTTVTSIGSQFSRANEEKEIARYNQMKPGTTMEESMALSRVKELPDMIELLPKLDTRTATVRRQLDLMTSCQVERIWKTAALGIRPAFGTNGCIHCAVYHFAAAMNGFSMSGKTVSRERTPRMAALVALGNALAVYAATSPDNDPGAAKKLQDQIQNTAKALRTDIKTIDTDEWNDLPACFEVRVNYNTRFFR